MAGKLVEFVTQLNGDPNLRDRFDRDPNEVLEGTDLSDEEKEVLASKDPERIRRAVTEDLGLTEEMLNFAGVQVVVTISVLVTSREI